MALLDVSLDSLQIILQTFTGQKSFFRRKPDSQERAGQSVHGHVFGICGTILLVSEKRSAKTKHENSLFFFF